MATACPTTIQMSVVEPDEDTSLDAATSEPGGDDEGVDVDAALDEAPVLVQCLRVLTEQKQAIAEGD
jgi:hypothetical protein